MTQTLYAQMNKKRKKTRDEGRDTRQKLNKIKLI
jgi:hypothetical protein